jgi:hypothetical protein
VLVNNDITMACARYQAGCDRTQYWVLIQGVGVWRRAFANRKARCFA